MDGFIRSEIRGDVNVWSRRRCGVESRPGTDKEKGSRDDIKRVQSREGSTQTLYIYRSNAGITKPTTVVILRGALQRDTPTQPFQCRWRMTTYDIHTEHTTSTIVCTTHSPIYTTSNNRVSFKNRRSPRLLPKTRWHYKMPVTLNCVWGQLLTPWVNFIMEFDNLLVNLTPACTSKCSYTTVLCLPVRCNCLRPNRCPSKERKNKFFNGTLLCLMSHTRVRHGPVSGHIQTKI